YPTHQAAKANMSTTALTAAAAGFQPWAFSSEGWTVVARAAMAMAKANTEIWETTARNWFQSALSGPSRASTPLRMPESMMKATMNSGSLIRAEPASWRRE